MVYLYLLLVAGLFYRYVMCDSVKLAKKELLLFSMEVTMVDNARAVRLGKRIGQIVANTLEHEIKDPRLDFVTITDVRLTGDLREATVYYTVLNPDLSVPPDYDAVHTALDKAKGQLRTAVGDGTGVRYTPSLRFELDTLQESATALESALDSARKRDEEIMRASQSARYAGEENPYKISS